MQGCEAERLRSLEQNELDYVVCTAIASMLTVNQHLTRLNLSHNPIAEAGAVQLAVGIKKTPILQELACVELHRLVHLAK
jgi:hypothetical protein